MFQNKLFSSKTNEFEIEALAAHNEYRREHGVAPLVLSKELCKISQKWAEELAKRDAMSYSQNTDYGESIYCGSSIDPNVKITAKDCVDKWYSQINDFSFGREPEVLVSGLFTQIIWKNTKELGIGNAKSKSGKLYVVANYNPPGNYSGQFSKNVLPPGANQFKTHHIRSSVIESNHNALSTTGSVTSAKSNKNIGDLATDFVNKLKTSSDDSFEAEFLDTHNEYRRKHGVPPLTLSRKLNKYAEEWAKILVKKGKMEHRDQNDYGENIYFAWSSDPNFKVTGADPVDKWYSEIKDHTFGREPKSLASGHFTQVIWEDSKEVGVGMAKSKEGQIYVVANYYPPGNVVGSFTKKVPPPI